uniref:Uncharacterized protein n=1 Tax=Arundo donax TaxID=35708 RepID=A0A0A8Y6U7_ARUDO
MPMFWKTGRSFLFLSCFNSFLMRMVDYR